LISYWPLDTILAGTKTPDLVSGYDMTLTRMGPTNQVAGKWGNAFIFDNAGQTLLERLDNPGEDLPIFNKSNFTVSVWVNGGQQTDHRVFSEGATANNNPLFNIGTHNTGADASVDSYIRNNSGAVNGDHRHTTAMAYDGTWHHIAYVHRDVGNGQMRAFMYVDGVQDPVVLGPIRPLTANTTSIGGIRRGSASAWFTGMIDEVAVWDRSLSPEEITLLQVTSITNPPSRLQPLTINSFKADVAAVASGDSTVLRWDVSKDATEITIDQGIGNVVPKTSVGIGTNSITLSNTTTFVLTIKRGVDTLSATTTVAVVSGVAPGWSLLDNFDRYGTGQLFGTGYWTDPHGNSAAVVDYKGNRVLQTVTADSIVFLNLQTLTVKEGQTATLFFRLIPGSQSAAGITNIIGLTDKSQRSYADEFVNIGSVVYPSAFTNDGVGLTTNGWFVGARNNVGGGIDFPADALEADTVYNVWIDVTNAPMGDPFYQNDVFTVYMAKEGTATRTAVFQDYVSDRDLFAIDAVLGGMRPDLDKLVVIGNSAAFSAMVDDFYLSKGGYNATVPRAYGFTGGTPPSAVQIGWSGNQVEIRWTSGVLQEASSITGSWTDVTGATIPSYKVTPSTGAKFYRARQ
jgi:hypothetical protein